MPNNFINAIRRNDLIAVKILLLQGMDVNTVDEGGRSGLHWAVINSNQSMIQCLLLHRADIDREDSQGFSPFDLLFVNANGELNYSISPNKDIARFLIQSGADVNTYYQGVPLLTDLISNGHYDLAMIAIEYGADINAFQIMENNMMAAAKGLGMTLLHHLAELGEEKEAILIMQKLISLKANVNARDLKSRTPLHHAAAYGNQNAVAILLAAGADRNLADEYGCTAAEIAEEEGYLDVAQLIRKYNGSKIINSNPANHSLNFLFSLLNINTNRNFQTNSYQDYPVAAKTNKKNQRTKFDYINNYTPALFGSEAIHHTQSNETQVENSLECIYEHSKRRVDLYFYHLIYYYKTGWEVKLANPTLQHGQGQNNPNNKKVKYLQACHSSLFSSPYGIIHAINNRNEPLDIEVIWDTNNHFYNVLNSTVLLPHIVNVIDGRIEGKITEHLQSWWRREALAIINLVSRGNINPIQGLTQFFQAADRFFPTLLEQFPSERDIKRRICLYEYEGTVNCNWNRSTNSVEKEYIYLKLNLSPQEQRIINQAPGRENEIFEEKYKLLRNEIMSGNVFNSMSTVHRL